MILLDVEVPNPRADFANEPKFIPGVIALSQSMGVRLYEDRHGACWISCADNSVWKSAHDFKTTIDQYAELSAQYTLTVARRLA